MTAPAFAVMAEPTRKRKPYRLLTTDDLAARPPLRWLVKGVLPDAGIAAIIGASGSGKTFLALDLAAALDRGGEWFDRRVTRCPVAYLALEGEGGIANRVRAYQSHSGHQISDRFRVVVEPFALLGAEDVPALAESLISAGITGGVVFIDTLNRAAAGADENSSVDMGLLIAAATELQIRVGGLVVIVHHSGKDAAKGARGHSSLFAALDACIEVTRNDDRRDWKISKSKDGEDGICHPFRLAVVEIGIDEDGDAVTSCAVEPDSLPAGGVRRAALPGGGNMRLAYDAISALLKDAKAYGMATAPPGRPCVELEAALVAVSDRLPVEPKRKRERAQLAITNLTTRKNIDHMDGWIWLP
ncbi:MAG: AAA family ATPase [Azoarcus sp.]|nr:AAA family ATPase [Azoarcus sp.]